jgi:hypothetical protein
VDVIVEASSLDQAIRWILAVALPAMASAIVLVWRQGVAERKRCDERFEQLAEKRTADYVALIKEQHAVNDNNTRALNSLTEMLDKVLDRLSERLTRP